MIELNLNLFNVKLSSCLNNTSLIKKITFPYTIFINRLEFSVYEVSSHYL